MLTIQITDGAYQAHMRRLLGRLSDFTPMVEEIGGTLENLVLGRCQTRTDPSGAAWSPWKDSTLKGYYSSRGQFSEREHEMNPIFFIFGTLVCAVFVYLALRSVERSDTKQAED